MKKGPLKIFMGINTFLIHVSRGKIGSHLGKQTILLMHTIGRKTAKQHTTPIAYFPAGNGYYVIGSNWGMDKNASWYYNLKEHPELEIEVNGKKILVKAREATGKNMIGFGIMP